MQQAPGAPSETPDPSGVRAVLLPLRAAAFAAVCVAVTAVGHQMEGGCAAGPVALGIAFALMFSAALVVAGREWSGAAIAAAMLGGQWVLHLLFDALGYGPVMAPAMDGHTGMAGSGLGMPAMHLAIVVLASWWLRRGEVACWRLVRRVESAAVAAVRAALDRLAGRAACPPADRAEGLTFQLVCAEPGGGMTPLRARCEPRRGPPPPRRPRSLGV